MEPNQADNPQPQTPNQPTPINQPVNEPAVEFIAPETQTPNQSDAQPVDTTPEPTVDVLHEKLERAKLAMEGEEHVAKRTAEEHQRALETEQKQLTDRLTDIGKEKEKLEVKWVDLDDRRTELKKTLTPILEQEEQVEGEERQIEEEEQKIAIERERKINEEKRRLIEDKRRGIENDKWVVEEKIWKLDDAIEENTKAYRALLDEEDEIQRRLEELEGELLQ